MRFGPLTGDSKAIKKYQSISVLHTLALTGTAASRKKNLLVLEEESLSCGYALTWMSLVRASTLVLLSTLN